MRMTGWKRRPTSRRPVRAAPPARPVAHAHSPPVVADFAESRFESKSVERLLAERHFGLRNGTLLEAQVPDPHAFVEGFYHWMGDVEELPPLEEDNDESSKMEEVD